MLGIVNICFSMLLSFIILEFVALVTTRWFAACRLVKPIQIAAPQTFALCWLGFYVLFRMGHKRFAAGISTKMKRFRSKYKGWHFAIPGNLHLTYRVDRIFGTVLSIHIAPLM
jgi:hypothetical protein